MSDKNEKNEKTDIIKQIENLQLNDVLNAENIDEVNPTTVLIVELNKLINLFESKDIIPKGFEKSYALLSNTNPVQKEQIANLISFNNNKKGQTKLMYREFILNLIKSLKTNIVDEKKSFLSRLTNKY